MDKSKSYKRTKFSPEVIREAVSLFDELVNPKGKAKLSYDDLTVYVRDTKWSHDKIEEFYADYRQTGIYARFARGCLDASSEPYMHSGLRVYFSGGDSDVDVAAPDRETIEAIFAIFEGHLSASKLPDEPKSPPPPLTIFVGHGHSKLWRDLKDHLHEKHGYAVEAYETGARAGHAIRDVLDEMASKSAFALLVLTGEDETADGKVRARQNVIHETGLFQGRLGFSRAIVLLEEGVEEFSNIHGIEQIRFSKGKIKETYGEVLATLKREFGGVE